MIALMIQNMHAVGVEEDTALLITYPRIISPAVPQPGNDGIKLTRAAVALVVLDVILQPKIQRRVRVGCCHHVPAGPTTADMIERGEAARDVIRLIEGG